MKKIIFFILLNSFCLLYANELINKEVISDIKIACAKSYPHDLLIKLVSEGENAFDTEVGRFESTPIDDEVLLICFRDFLKPDLKFLDLGSGDGRVVFLASLYGVDAYGIEYDKSLYEISIQAKKRLRGLIKPERISFIQGDFLKCDFKKYDIFYLYAGTNALPQLMKKLYEEMKPGSILISYDPAKEESENNRLSFLAEYGKNRDGDSIVIYQKNN